MEKRRLTRYIKGGMICFTILLVVSVGGVYGVSWLQRHRENSYVEALANRIDVFKKTYGRLPDASNKEEMQNLGFELRVGWYPDFVSFKDMEYELWLYHGFDGPHRVYSSKTKTWREAY